MKTYYNRPASILYINKDKNEKGFHNYCGEGTNAYKKKLGVTNPIQIDNKITTIELDSMFYTSGDRLYGARVATTLITTSGHKLFMTLDGIQIFKLIQKYGVTDSKLQGEFSILFYGVVHALCEYDSIEYHNHEKTHLEEVKKHAMKIVSKNTDNIELEKGKVYTLNGVDHIYVGRKYLMKPIVSSSFRSNADIGEIKVTKPTQYYMFIKTRGKVNSKSLRLLSDSSYKKLNILESKTNEIHSITEPLLDIEKEIREYDQVEFIKAVNKVTSVGIDARRNAVHASIRYLYSKTSDTLEGVQEHTEEDLKRIGKVSINNTIYN